MKLSYLYGSSARTLLREIRTHRIEPTARNALTVAGLGAMSVGNSALRTLDERCDYRRTRVEAPIFLLGHWRSGTTHLQYLLSQDPQLATPNTYDVCFPESLLSGERSHGRLLGRLLPGRRLQDAMAFGMNVPNEDEIALAALGLPTPYRYWAFPEAEEEHLRFLSFRDAHRGEVERFRTGLDGYLRKLAFKYRRRLLLKSPPHTARIRLLRSMYPDARFVHIHRHPYDVFRSTLHLHATWHDNTVFLQPAEADATARILSAYGHMMDCLLEDAPQLPDGRFCSLSYERLVRNPMSELRRIYDLLGLSDFPEHRFRAYLEGEARYRTNRYTPLSADQRALVFGRWRRYFDAFGYVDLRRARRGRSPRPGAGAGRRGWRPSAA